MSRSTQRPILIAGPTASGKSALALAIAERVGGVIINADSMQVYSELRILTARPDADDEARASHRLYGHVTGADGYSAARFAEEAGREIAEAEASGRVPIIVGGTGLYFMALIEGLSPVPPIPEEVRAHWRAEAQRLGPQALHGVLAARDPAAAARLNPTDPQRVTRALEVFDATGRSLIDWQAVPGVPVVRSEATLRLVLRPKREAMIARCAGRFTEMMAAGALAEVAEFVAADIPPDRPVWGALGVRPLAAHLMGEMQLEAAIVQANIETRQFAKRQMTWLNSRMSSWNDVQLEYSERNDGLNDSFVDSLIVRP